MNIATTFDTPFDGPFNGQHRLYDHGLLDVGGNGGNGVSPDKVQVLYPKKLYRLISKFEQLQIKSLSNADVQEAQARHELFTAGMKDCFNHMKFGQIALFKAALPISSDYDHNRAIVAIVKKSLWFALRAKGGSALLACAYYFGYEEIGHPVNLANGIHTISHSTTLEQNIRAGAYGTGQALAKLYFKGSNHDRNNIASWLRRESHLSIRVKGKDIAL